LRPVGLTAPKRQCERFGGANPFLRPGLMPWTARFDDPIPLTNGRALETFARIGGMLRALNRHVERAFNPDRKDHHWGRQKAKEGPMTVLIYVDTNKPVGDKDHLKVFANAETWFEENDPEGVAFEYEVLE
jgi:hypothetical protein